MALEGDRELRRAGICEINGVGACHLCLRHGSRLVDVSVMVVESLQLAETIHGPNLLKYVYDS